MTKAPGSRHDPIEHDHKFSPGSSAFEIVTQTAVYEIGKAGPIIHVTYELRTKNGRRAQTIEFRLLRGNANALIADFNGSVSVGYKPTSASFSTVTIDGAGEGTVAVTAQAGANPATDPVTFSFARPKDSAALSFTVSHVDASLVIGSLNAVVNTN